MERHIPQVNTLHRIQLGEVPYESDAEESDYDHLTEMLDVDSELEVDVDSDDEAHEVD